MSDVSSEAHRSWLTGNGPDTPPTGSTASRPASQFDGQRPPVRLGASAFPFFDALTGEEPMFEKIVSPPATARKACRQSRSPAAPGGRVLVLAGARMFDMVY